jgi:ornithine cyclodeaminase/alanine dehydrogenase-like protein (mu-crystallin family)
MRVIDARGLPPMEVAIDALEAAFARPLPDTPARTFLPTDTGDLGVMPAAGEQGAGVKLVTIIPGNPGRGLPLIHGVYVLFAPGTGEVEGVIDGGALTGLRTAAVSGVATRHLARADARHLVIFGAGTQAHAHLDAMVAVRPVGRVTVVSRTAARAESLAGAARERGLEARLGDPSAVAEADIVCTCTTSDAPLFDGRELAAGAHVNAVGTYRPDARELDAATLARAARVVVETRAAALEEAGDVVLALREGALSIDGVAELGEVVADRVRREPSDVTVFKSVGMAFEDLVVARAALDAVG